MLNLAICLTRLILRNKTALAIIPVQPASSRNAVLALHCDILKHGRLLSEENAPTGKAMSRLVCYAVGSGGTANLQRTLSNLLNFSRLYLKLFRSHLRCRIARWGAFIHFYLLKFPHIWIQWHSGHLIYTSGTWRRFTTAALLYSRVI